MNILAFRRAFRRRRLVAACAVASLLVGVSAAARWSVLPPAIHARDFGYAAASTTLVNEGARSPVLDLRQSVRAHAPAAEIDAEFLQSRAALKQIAAAVGVPSSAIHVQPKPNTVQKADDPAWQPGRHATPLDAFRSPRRLELQFQPQLQRPFVRIWGTGPDLTRVKAMVNGAAQATVRFSEQARAGLPEDGNFGLQQMDPAVGGTVSATSPFARGVLVALATAGILAAALTILEGVRDLAQPPRRSRWRPSD